MDPVPTGVAGQPIKRGFSTDVAVRPGSPVSVVRIALRDKSDRLLQLHPRSARRLAPNLGDLTGACIFVSMAVSFAKNLDARYLRVASWQLKLSTRGYRARSQVKVGELLSAPTTLDFEDASLYRAVRRRVLLGKRSRLLRGVPKHRCRSLRPRSTPDESGLWRPDLKRLWQAALASTAPEQQRSHEAGSRH